MRLYFIDQNGEIDTLDNWEGNTLPVECEDEIVVSLNIYPFTIKVWGKIKIAAMRKADANFLAKLIEKGVTGEPFKIR